MFKDIANSIIGSLLSLFKEQTINSAKSNLIKNSMQNAREAMLSHVAEQYSREVEHNISQYVKSLEAAEVEVSYEGRPGEALIVRAQSAIDELEAYLEAQNPDGAVIRYLKQRYNEEGIRIITGRLYAGHYVSRKTQGVYEVLNLMGYAAPVDTRKPWLSSNKTISGVESIVANAASDLFEIIFEGVDLSDELANLDFSGVGGELASSQGSPGIEINARSVMSEQIQKSSRSRKKRK